MLLTWAQARSVEEAWQGAPGPWLDLAHGGAYERSEQLLLVVLVPPHEQGGGRQERWRTTAACRRGGTEEGLGRAKKAVIRQI